MQFSYNTYFRFNIGGDIEGNPGVSLFLRGSYLVATLSTGDQYWSIHVPGAVRNNTWSNIGVKWYPGTGTEESKMTVICGNVLILDC